MIQYGGTENEVRAQLTCDHDWQGPGIDSISRYYKCMFCYCLKRDMTDEEFILARNPEE